VSKQEEHQQDVAPNSSSEAVRALRENFHADYQGPRKTQVETVVCCGFNMSVAVLMRKGNDHGSTNTLKYVTLSAREERKGGKMAKPLDGTALLAYFRRFNFSQETQELLKRIRSSPQNRTPGAR
jgi:hypothetical protein